MSKFDPHTLLTIVIVVAIVVLLALDIGVPVELYVLLAAVSPGLVLRTKADRAADAAAEREPPVLDPLLDPIVLPSPKGPDDAA